MKKINLSKKQSPIFIKKEIINYFYINKALIKNDNNVLDNMIIEDSEIDELVINQLKCKNLVFKNCILKKVEIKNIKCNRIDFINCKVETEIVFFRNEVDTINIEHLKSYKIKFLDLEVLLLSLNKINTGDLEINHVTKNNIKKMILKDSDIFSNVYIKNLNGEKLNVNNVNTKDFILNNITMKDGIVDISESKLDLISIEKLYANSLTLELLRNNSKICFINQIVCENESYLFFKEGFYENLTIKQVNLLRIDITQSDFYSLSIDEEIYQFLIDKKYYNFLFLPNDLEQNMNTLKILAKIFGDNYEFSLQDECYYWFNNLKLTNQIKNNKFPKNLYYLINYLIGVVFGWGVKLKNIFYSFLFITLLFGLMYGYLIKKFSLIIDFHQVKFFNFLDGFLISFLVMLNYFSDFSYQNFYFFNLLIIQSIISIVFLTILTGAIVRKLVR